MQMLTIRIFQGCQHATAFFWAGQCGDSWCPFKRFQSASRKLACTAENSSHLSEKEGESYLKKKNKPTNPNLKKTQINFASYVLGNSFLSLKVHNPQGETTGVRSVPRAGEVREERSAAVIFVLRVASAGLLLANAFPGLAWVGSHTERFCPFLFSGSSRAEQSGDPGPIVELPSGQQAKGVERWGVGGRFQFQ